MHTQTADELKELEANATASSRKLAVEVIADDSGKFCGNGLRFDTAEQAVAYGYNLASRWVLVREFRVVLAD